MSLRFTDNNNKQYWFDDSQKEVVKSLAEENARLQGRVLELECEMMILEEKLKATRESQAEAAEIVNSHIAYLDPDQS